MDDHLCQNTFSFNFLFPNFIPSHLIIITAITSVTPSLPGGNLWPGAVHSSPLLSPTCTFRGCRFSKRRAPLSTWNGSRRTNPKDRPAISQQLTVSCEQSEGAREWQDWTLVFLTMQITKHFANSIKGKLIHSQWTLENPVILNRCCI